MNETGYSILKLSKFDGAYVYAKEAREFATGSTGAGGYLNAKAVASGWNDVEFINTLAIGNTIPTTIGIGSTSLITGGVTTIGGTTPIGDLRAEATGYIGIGTTIPYIFEKGKNYSGALMAIYKGTTWETGKIGIGTTAGDITASGYYEGNFTTNDIHEFQTSFTADSTDLSKITTGSGVYTEGADVTLQFNILNRNGEQLSSAAQIAADPFVSGQKISILNTDGSVVFPDYRIGGDSTFNFSSSQNIDVFGTFTRNFGIRNEVVNQDGGVHTSEFYLYANTATFDKVFVRSSGQTVLNESYTNNSPPDTGSISSAADRADAIKYFNNQPINDSGVTGFIEFDLGFNESPNFTSLGDVVLFHGTGEDFTTNRGSLVGNFPLNSVQEGQRIRLTANDGIPEGTGLFFKLAADTEVGFNEELFTVGPFTLEPTVEGPDLNLYNQGDQLLVGDFTIEGGLDGDDAEGGNLNVSGNALGTGIGGRLTGPDSKMYLLSGDEAGGSSDTLQDVVDRGNATTKDINYNGSKIIFNGDSDKSINFENDALTLGIGITRIESNFLGIGATTNKIVMFPDQSIVIGSDGIIVGGSPATGSSILAGTGNVISGHFNTLVGGAGNKISGSLLGFNFVGGGSGIDITGSQYSSSVGGKNNDILNSNYSIIGGGSNNKIKDATSSFIGGGEVNEIHDGVSAIVGGNAHIISGGNGYSFIGGGEENEIHGTFSSVLGGEGNKNYGNDSVTLGGWFTESSGRFALVGPGKASKVSGDYGVALGNKVEIPVAHTGATVLADGQDRVHASSGMHTATLDFASGVYVPTIGYFGEGLHVSGVPVLTGENNPAEADTLQTVTTRGNETTTSIFSTGPYISGVTGYYKDTLRVGDGGFVDFPSAYDTLQVGTSSSATNGHILVRGKESSITFRGVEGSDKAHTIKEDAGTLTFYGDSTLSGTAGNARFAIQTGQSYFTDLVGVQGNGVKPQFYLASIGGGASNKATHFYQPANSADFRIALNGSQHNGTIGTDAFAIKSTYEIGVGTVDPRAALHVDNGAGATTGFLVENSSNKNILWAEDNETINARSTFNVYHTTVASRYLRLGWGSIFANDNGNELTLGSNFSSASATRIFVGAEGAANIPANTIQMQANHGLAVFSGVSTDTFDPTALLDVRGDAYISGDVEGTGAGNRITNNGVPYLLSGDSPAETQNLDQVLAQGNTSTRDMSVADISGSGLFLSGAGSAGPEISLQGAYTTWEIENQYAGGANNDMFRIRNTALADDALVINRGNNKVGIGTTNPTNDLHVVGTMQLDNSVSDAFKIRINGGVGLALDHNSIRSTNAGTDVTFAAGKDLIFQTYDGGFKEAMRIDTSGRVGIGTTSPSSALEVRGGSIDIGTNDIKGAANSKIEMDAADGFTLTNPNNAHGVDIVADDLTFFGGGLGNRKITTNAGDLSIDPTADLLLNETAGNVGIGTDSPSTKFHLGSGIARFQNAGSNYIEVDGSVAGANIARISSRFNRFEIVTNAGAGDPDISLMPAAGGNVGIGNNAPAEALSISTAAEAKDNNIDFLVSNSYNAGLLFRDPAGGRGSIISNTDNDLIFSTNGTGISAETMRIDSAGNVGIGTTNPSQTLHVKGIGIIEDASSTSFGTLQFGTDTSRYVRGNSAEIQFGSTIQQLHFQKTNGPAQVASSAANGVTAIQLLARNVHTSANLLEVVNGNGQTADFVIDSAGNVGIGATEPSVGLQLGNSTSGQTKTAIFNSEGGAEVGLTIKSRTNRAKLAVSDNDTTAYVVAEGTIASFGRADTAATTNISVLANGDVGIGTTNPAAKLELLGKQMITAGANASPQTEDYLYIGGDGLAGADAAIYIGNRGNGSGYGWRMFYEGTGSGVNNKLKFKSENLGSPVDVITMLQDGKVGIGTTSPSNALDVVGHFSATSKSFLIDHPTKENKKLQYASLEGPENGVYVRGTTDKETIELPEYWSELVHEDSITVVLTPIGKKQDLFIKEKSNKLIKIGGAEGSFDYVVYGERKDIDKLEIEPLKV